MQELNFESFDDALAALDKMAQKIGRKGKTRRIERVRLEAEINDGDLDTIFNALAEGAGTKGKTLMLLFSDRLIVADSLSDREVKRRLVNQIVKQNLS